MKTATETAVAQQPKVAKLNFLPPEVTAYSTKEMSHEDWLAFRTQGIGGSEVATTMGLNPFKSKLQLFYEKIGLADGRVEENPVMWYGKVNEDKIANLWQYWDGDFESLKANYAAGNKIKKCFSVNAYLVRDKYPHLFASLDKRMAKGNNEDGANEHGALEIKTLSGFYADQWEAGIPPYHLVQLQTYLLVTGWTYGEIFVECDRKYKGYRFTADAEIQQQIIESTTEFWERVVAGRAILQEMVTAGVDLGNLEEFWFYYEQAKQKPLTEQSDLEKLVIAGMAKIRAIEPETEDTKSYEKFLRKTFKAYTASMQGNQEDIAKARQYKKASDSIKHWEAVKRGAKNHFISRMRDGDVMTIGNIGKVTNKANKNGIQSIRVSIKED